MSEPFLRCDACNDAGAIVRVTITSAGDLDFCRRCMMKNTAGLYGKVDNVTLGPGASEVLVNGPYVRSLLGVK